MVKTGIGYDVHQLKKGEKLIVGGINIPSEFGSLGHSDGDGLIHAIVDALLGAAALGDIGVFFPSESDEWENADSKIFLQKAIQEVKSLGYSISHVDSTIVLQNPKLRPFIETIRENLSNIMEIPLSSISVKATTTDHLGFEGEGSGWSVQSIVTLEK